MPRERKQAGLRGQNLPNRFSGFWQPWEAPPPQIEGAGSWVSSVWSLINLNHFRLRLITPLQPKVRVRPPVAFIFHFFEIWREAAERKSNEAQISGAPTETDCLLSQPPKRALSEEKKKGNEKRHLDDCVGLKC